ncbi:WD repeat-containing protein 18-like [Ornithodoros turicata]|uniref:WD repeat-containing protein 18-like n=1 Tax=Ornithodoros turicata TaxID=34597 RepID=UPI00313A38F0
MASFECIFTSDSDEKLWNICAWDIVTGSVLKIYKGESSAPRTLCIIGSDYLISANPNKPVLQTWSLERSEQLQTKHICPGKVSALAVSPDGAHCIAGIQEKIFIWQICTGDLLAILSLHFQSITCLRFSDDGCHFASASRDGQVIAWDLNAAVTPRLTGGTPDPLHVWSHHSNDVTDLYFGLGGTNARVISCSLDQTCRVYELHSGEQLFEAVLDSALTAVVADAAESNVFAGSLTGAIYQVALYSADPLSQHGSAFTGHGARVTCLSVSIDGQLLVSGSEDRTARVWDIPSRQCIQVLQHKGHVTNAFIAPTPIQLQTLKESCKPLLPLAKFKSSVDAEGKGGAVRVNLATVVKKKAAVRINEEDGANHKLYERMLTTAADGDEDMGDEEEDDDGGAEMLSVEDLRKEVARLKQVNQQLYDFAANRVISCRQDGSVDGMQQ